MKRVLAVALLCAAGTPAQTATPAAPAPESASLHFQATVATQAHPSFSADYSGKNSLQPGSESATSVVMDLFAAVRAPWPGGELYLQPELSGGRGLSSTLGVAAFPSGEVYRVGDPEPNGIIGQFFYRQTFNFGGGETRLDAAPGQLAGSRDRDSLIVSFGKLATTDTFDIVPLVADPHARFMSWGLWASAAFDYPADTRGYTYGITFDYARDRWSARLGMFLEPQEANGMEMEWDIGKARSLVAEVERRFPRGAVKLLGFFNTAYMGSYSEATALNVDVTQTRADGRTKAGLAASASCDFGGGLGGFARASWNDGHNETWAFTEIDRSLAFGVVQTGERWRRPLDDAGIALVVSGLSPWHRAYLASGHYGFLIGDGALDYASEVLGEIYYRAAIDERVSIGVNYQPIFDPAYNSARGMVHVFTARGHVIF